jgi:DNA-binding phage protein
MKTPTHPWDPTEHIETGDDVIAYLKEIFEEEDDPEVIAFMLNCISRSKGVQEVNSIAVQERTLLHRRSVTITVTSGAAATIRIGKSALLDSLCQALSPNSGTELVTE